MATESTQQVACDVKDLALADMGKRRMEWAFQSMPVLQTIRKQFIKTQPLAGIRIAACLHVTTETANLMVTLRDGGALAVVCASNPLSTQDDVAASLVRDYGIPVYAIKGENNDVYYSHIAAASDHKPQITMDDGADLVHMLHTKRRDLLDGVLGGTEETTTGVIRLRAMAKEGVLRYPIVAVNDARTKHVIAKDHFEKMKNGAILCNSGHFNIEIDLEALGKVASSRRPTREFVEEFALRDGRRIYVLGEGRLINLAAAEGHPASVMDMSFANQALASEYMVKNHATLEKTVHSVPEHLDKQVAKLKLEAMKVSIDRLTVEQEHYLSSWSEGT